MYNTVIDLLIASWTSKLMIPSHFGSNPVKGKLMFLSAKNFKQIAQYWLVPGTD